MRLPNLSQILRNRARHEQNDHHCRRDPKRPVQIRVAIKDIEEVCAGKQRGAASFENLVGVDVEELGVEGQCPEEVLVAARGP